MSLLKEKINFNSKWKWIIAIILLLAVVLLSKNLTETIKGENDQIGCFQTGETNMAYYQTYPGTCAARISGSSSCGGHITVCDGSCSGTCYCSFNSGSSCEFSISKGHSVVLCEGNHQLTMGPPYTIDC
jgi:glutamine amidotransferase-like uncharacterized protein